MRISAFKFQYFLEYYFEGARLIPRLGGHRFF